MEIELIMYYNLKYHVGGLVTRLKLMSTRLVSKFSTLKKI